MHVLFVGGTRFIGRHAAVRLVQMGHKVTVFHRGKSEGELPPEVGHIHGDRAQLLAVRSRVWAGALRLRSI